MLRRVKRTARDGDTAFVGGERDGSVGKPAGDVGEQPTRDEHSAGLLHLGRDLGAG